MCGNINKKKTCLAIVIVGQLQSSPFQGLMKNSVVLATAAEISVLMFEIFDHFGCAGQR